MKEEVWAWICGENHRQQSRIPRTSQARRRITLPQREVL